MHTQLETIFEMRNALLKRCNLKFYRQHEQVIKNSSLAAQDFYFSGDLDDYDMCSLHDLVHDSLYASLHAAYNVPYQSSDTRCVNSGLVLDLARALRDDINSGILGKTGEVMMPERLKESQVLHTYHNSEDSGIPVNFLKHMTPNAVKVFLWQSGQGKKR